MALGDTRNQTWANDKSKFGYKMLQKMGWMEGKGLGVNEDGTTEHIRIRRKTTTAGVGGEAALDDWNKPAHVAAGLNDVLARLAPVNCSAAVVKTEKVTKKGRGYFQRRSAGKNVSGYSEKDLKEIFGGINVDSKIENGDAETDTTIQEGERGGEDMSDHKKRDFMKEEDIEQITESLPGPDDRKKRKALEKEERKRAKAKAKAKRKSLAVEVTIKKVKKSKKSKKSER